MLDMEPPGAGFRDVDEGVYAGEQEVNPQGPEGEVGEETKGLANTSRAGLERVCRDAEVAEIGCGSVVCQPAVANNDGRKAIQRDRCSYTS